jgi:hypothetical protein
MNLQIPLDFERLPEFWQLLEALRVRGVKNVTESQVNDTAQVLFLRLFVVLGYLARHTNRPGWLNAAGERQFNGAFNQFGDDCPPTLLLEGNLLRKDADGYYCDLFTQYNRHLAGDYVSKEKAGNIRSRLNAAKTNIAAMALQQGMLLSPELYKKRDGTPMDKREQDRSVILILTLDRCLTPSGTKTPARPQPAYTPGLMADACAVINQVTPGELQEFYYWLAERNQKPLAPETTEEVLRDWDRIWKAFNLKTP